MAKNLIIIPCCAKKNAGGVLINQHHTFFENNDQVPELISRRNNRKDQFPPKNAHEFMQAWDRYDGRIYRRLKEQQNLINTLLNDNCIDIVILSALYGVINYKTSINNYDLEMGANNGVDYWAADNLIANSINIYCGLTGVENIYTFLRPDTYYRALRPNFLMTPHSQLWPVGLRGPMNVLNHVSDHIIQILNNIFKECQRIKI
jgi:hypothetical protein